ncbi:MAG: carboxymuconolactone decarboxylase family protein [Sphingomonadales bacterium]|nr:carboxymuconolactone decarboxylase family protein [Sphingomonadales bacterium]
MSGEAVALLRGVRQMFHIPLDATVPEISLIQLRHTGLFRVQMELGIAVAGQSDIPAHDRELVIMRVAWLTRTPFEWSEHAAIGRRFGLTGKEIERVKDGSSAPGWSKHDAAVLRATEELLGDYCISDATWAVLAESWNDKALMEMPLLVANYVAIAFQVNSLKVPLQPDKRGFFDT